MSSSHPFGSRRDRSVLPELKCWIYKLQLLTSVLCPEFWDYVSCRRNRIPNPWLKSLCKAQHCLLQRKKENPEECLFKAVNIPTIYHTCLSLSCFPFQPSSSMLNLLGFFTISTHHPVFFFLYIFYFSFPAEALLSSRFCFLIFLWKSAFCKSTLPFAGGRARVYWALQLPWHSSGCVWMFVFSKPFC